MSSTAQNFKENFLSVQQPTKNVDSSRKHQTKKVFGEIKNVIHNQGIVTPLKPDQKQNRNASSSKFISPANIKLKQQNRSEYKSRKILKAQMPIFDDYHLDDFDFRGKCCLKTNKSDQQVWSEMNLYSDVFLDNIFDAKKLDQMEDIVRGDFEKEHTDEPELSDNESGDFDLIFWPERKDCSDDADIHLMFEKPLLFDFNF